MDDENVKKELDDLFEKHWAKFPTFPIPEEHERHKIAAKSAFYAGYMEGLLGGISKAYEGRKKD